VLSGIDSSRDWKKRRERSTIIGTVEIEYQVPVLQKKRLVGVVGRCQGMQVPGRQEMVESCDVRHRMFGLLEAGVRAGTVGLRVRMCMFDHLDDQTQ